MTYSADDQEAIARLEALLADYDELPDEPAILYMDSDDSEPYKKDVGGLRLHMRTALREFAPDSEYWYEAQNADEFAEVKGAVLALLNAIKKGYFRVKPKSPQSQAAAHLTRPEIPPL